MNFESAPLAPILDRMEAISDMICTFDHRLAYTRNEHTIEVVFHSHTGAVTAVVLIAEVRADATVEVYASFTSPGIAEDRVAPAVQSIYAGALPLRGLDEALTAWLATWYGDCVRQLSSSM
ncbi:hypothetical protein Alches_27620 [Alicyclobacillus hesperidum subsp. aegles]|uniref:hypothetical protein n=1 Tax=Alicyclobacillus hesperidum TaxID=89784 RepID=UPI00071941A9|nr:hypothetical protein [Alicyclobacillus hesperidum]KRW91359.1 hypothetical protein SD51_09175 [Alicyclobacillus tengchongensis]GLG02721.1 hypothetical protein Alches_27620 [Alicyclobacillus hesperidum subsp. aegles]